MKHAEGQWAVHARAFGLWTIVFTAVVFMSMGCDGGHKQVANGEPAPAFALTQLGGGAVRFPDDCRGQVIAVRFWADWCPYCRDEMTGIEPIYRKYRDQGFRVFAVNVRQSADVAEAFVRKLNISYEVLLDSEGEVARNYGVAGLPTTFFIGRDGTVKTRILGEATTDVFERIVADLL